MDSTEQRFWFFEHYLAHSNTELKYLKNTQKINKKLNQQLFIVLGWTEWNQYNRNSLNM